MLISDLNFTPYEGEFYSETKVSVAETWINDTVGFRIFDNKSRSSDNTPMYWVIKLEKQPDGSIVSTDFGYQLESFFIL